MRDWKAVGQSEYWSGYISAIGCGYRNESVCVWGSLKREKKREGGWGVAIAAE